MDCEPLMDLAPDQAPEAVQAVALLDVQVKARAVAAGDRARARRQGYGRRGLRYRDRRRLRGAAPRPRAGERIGGVGGQGAGGLRPARGFLEPDQAPEAVQEVALVDDHVRVDAAPLAMVLGLALRLTAAVGVEVTVTVAD